MHCAAIISVSVAMVMLGLQPFSLGLTIRLVRAITKSFGQRLQPAESDVGGASSQVHSWQVCVAEFKSIPV